MHGYDLVVMMARSRSSLASRGAAAYVAKTALVANISTRFALPSLFEILHPGARAFRIAVRFHPPQNDCQLTALGEGLLPSL